jgi:hypothetical protein
MNEKTKSLVFFISKVLNIKEELSNNKIQERAKSCVVFYTTQ